MSPARAPARILFFYGSQQFDTGSPRSLAALIDMLDRDAFEPLFLARGEGPLLAALEARNVTIVRGAAGQVTWRRPLAAWRAVRRQRALLREQGIGLVYVNELGWNLDLVLAAWSAGIPVVLHVRLPEDVSAQNLHRFAARRVVFVSEAQRRATGHVQRIRARSVVLPNALDTAWYGGGHDIRAALGLSPDDLVVCTVAQLRQDKGIALVLEAARLLAPGYPSLRFLVVGPLGRGEEEFGRRMMAEAGRPPLDSVVRFTGSRQDIPDVLASSNLFLLPTRAETFGRAVAEGMAAGLPVIATRIPALEEVVTSPDLGVLVSPWTGGAFADAIRGVLDRPDRGRAMGEAGRRSLAGRLDRGTVARQLNALLADLARRPPGS